MFIIIPLGGIGERFKSNGYTLPKALINIFGKPILYYLLDNLNLNHIDFILIPYNKEYSNYRFEDKLQNNYPHIKFIFCKLNDNTNGATQTINIALKQLDISDCPCISLDGDNFFTTDILHLWNGENKIITFDDLNDNPIYSYIKSNDNIITDIVEKNKISNNACTGAYGFSSYKTLLYYTQHVINNNIRQKNEFYISNVIKEMITHNEIFTFSQININNWHCLGTPIQLRQFYNNYPCTSAITNNTLIKKIRICFDLDNTLVTFPKIKNDYTTVEPIMQNIIFLKYLKNFGHTIIIYTARRMKTHNGNVGKIMCDIGKITFDTLDKFNIPFDEIYFGKPYADVYIDDLALNCHDNMEKYLGFYMDNIAPRDFNSLESNTIDTYTKKSHDLSGEIFYYNNIPNSLKDLFPVMIKYDTYNKWYTMEKINGTSVSSLYLSELLTPNMLIHIMNSIKRIQSINIMINDNINIYDNYSNKIKQRFTQYDYSKFENSNIIYESICDKLNIYESHNKGKISVIHGDPVMTNIIINNFGKIKFIDMRGKIGEILTIFGDWLYDWAKLYQSIIGYDEILQSKTLSIIYKNNMIDIFEKYFISMYSDTDLYNLKVITASLLFSLVPLHDNDKCQSYINISAKCIPQ